jgi:peptidoglycan/LPS O-acetylase OafA/YrhL
MDTTRKVVMIAAVVGGLGWIGKIVIMAVQGGPDPESLLEAIAFFSGLLGALVTAAAGGVYLARARPTLLRLLAAVGAVIVVAMIVGVGQAGLGALGDAWIYEEAIFGLAGAALIILAVAMRQPADRPAP